jgi:hypothetical protein
MVDYPQGPSAEYCIFPRLNYHCSALFLINKLSRDKKSRVGAVALDTVLWTVVAKYRKLRFSAPHRTKTL